MNERWKEDLQPYLTEAVRRMILPFPARLSPEELRIRVNRPVQIVCADSDRLLSGADGTNKVSQADVDTIIARICGQSVYAYAEELSYGFVTLPGGYRAGVAGRCVAENGKTLRLTNATSVNIRIPRAVHGAADGVLSRLARHRRILPTLILSQPGCGKTTFLRELIRLASTGCGALIPEKGSVVDTRAELCGSVSGAGLFDLGPRTDVRTGGDKAGGLSAMLQTMSPNVVATDEIGSFSDARAVLDARFAGVTVLATAHARTLGELALRPAYKTLIQNRAFERYVVLSRRLGPGTVENVYGANGERIYESEEACARQSQC